MERQEDTPQPPADDQSTHEEHGTPMLDLKILSPSSELPPQGLMLGDVPATSTVGQLRTRITAAIPSHPAADRQRLIYLGRVLARDSDTLASIFGETAVQQQRQHTLHLVLRDGQPSAAPSAPSSIPRPSSVAYAASSIPRPSSVPPRATDRDTPSPSPLRAGNWPQQTSAPNNSAPTTNINTPSLQRPLPPGQQPPSRSRTPGDQPIIRSVTGNIRATVTSNGQPVNVPPEVINQLLNQHLHRNGNLEGLFAQAQAQAQAQARQQQPADQAPPQQRAEQGSQPPTPPIAPTPTQQPGGNHNSFQQFMASVGRNMEGTGTPDGQAPQQERGRSTEQENAAAERPTVNLPVNDNRTGDQEQQSRSAPPAPQPNGAQPHGHFTMRIEQRTGPIPGMPGMPFPMPFPQGMQMPMMPGPGMPIPMAAPVAGLRPGAQGTPRSGSPARSVSEGPRRIGTPAAELQHRLMHTNQEINNLNTLLGVLASGQMANGQPASPLSEDQLAQIRGLAESMNTHIAGFGQDLSALANAHPSIRFQPEFAGLHSMYNTVQAQGQGVFQRIDGLANRNAQFAQMQGRTASNGGSPSNTQAPSPSLSRPTPANLVPPPQNPTPPSQSTPSTTSDTLSSSNLTRENSPNSTANPPPAPMTLPEMHLLSDPTNTQHYLLIGPTGPLGTGQIPLDVLYPLLATQLPYEQLLRDFNRATLEMTHALQRQDLRASLRQSFNIPLPGSRSNRSSDATTVPQPPNDDANAQPRVHLPPANNGQAQPAAGAPQAQGQAAAPEAAGRQRARGGGDNEMRDILAPVVRNIWLIIRLAMFAWFFFSSGRGSGRVIFIAILAGIVYAVNNGMLAQYAQAALDGFWRHFEEVVDEAVDEGQAQNGALQAPATPQAGSSRASEPTPEDTARRLMLERAARQRRGVRDAVRRVERTVLLGVASLWPGVGEAVVRNAERRRREAEEARRKEEEERQKKIAEEEENRKAAEATVGIEGTVAEGSSSAASGNDAGSEGLERVNKGKERAEASTAE